MDKDQTYLHLPASSRREPPCTPTEKRVIVAVSVSASAVIVMLFLVAVFSVSVPAGHVGVMVRFGSVEDQHLEPGLHFIGFFTTVELMNVQTRIVAMEEDVPSKEGLSVHLEAAALFHLDRDSAVAIYKQIGVNYLDVVVVPQFRSILRSITSGHDAKDLYTAAARSTMTQDLKDELTKSVQPYGIVIESTPLKKITLPQTIQNAIQAKLQAEQETQRMEFVLTKEAKEAERKKIEAQGIQEFQDIVRKGIDEHLLRWKGIEATERIAESHNSKLVMIGSGTAGGLPVILNPPDAA